MVSDERRNKKPYALPVQYIPYYSLKDQYIRDFTKVLKQNMVQLGLHVVGKECNSNAKPRVMFLFVYLHSQCSGMYITRAATFLINFVHK